MNQNIFSSNSSMNSPIGLITFLFDVVITASMLVLAYIWLAYPKLDINFDALAFLLGSLAVVNNLVTRFIAKVFPFKKVALDLDYKNAMFSTLVLDKTRSFPCLVLYNISIVNVSHEDFTIKEILLRYSYKGKKEEVDSSVIQTGDVYSPLDKKNTNSIIVHINDDKIVLMDWENIRTEIGKHEKLSSGSVLNGSAIFPFLFSDYDDCFLISKLELIVTDFEGKKTTCKIRIEREAIEKWKKSYIQPSSFKSDANGNIKD